MKIDPLQLISPSEVINKVMSQYFKIPISGGYLVSPNSLLVIDRGIFNIIDNYFNSENSETDLEKEGEEVDNDNLDTFYSIVIPNLFLISFPSAIPQIKTLLNAIYQSLKIE